MKLINLRSPIVWFSNLWHDKRNHNQLLREGLASVAIKIGHTILMFTVTVLLARNLGANGYGIYAYIFALIIMLSIPVQFGLPTLLVREVAAKKVLGEWGLIRGIQHRTNQIVLTITVTLTGLAALSIWYWHDNFTKTEVLTFVLGLILLPFLALTSTNSAALRGHGHVLQGQLPELIIRPGLFLALILIAVTLMPEGWLSPPAAMSLHAIGAGFALFYALWLLIRTRTVSEKDSIPVYKTYTWILSAIPLALNSGIQFINSNTDILMLGFFVPTTDLGIYKVATQCAMIVVLGLQAMNMIVSPSFSSLYATADMKNLQQTVTASARIITLTALPFTLIFILFGHNILDYVFGIEYRDGYYSLVILSLAQLVNAAMGSVGYLLNMTGHEHDAAVGAGIALIVNIILNLLLIPVFGINGAATATAISLICWNILLCWSVYHRLGVDSTALGYMSRYT